MEPDQTIELSNNDDTGLVVTMSDIIKRSLQSMNNNCNKDDVQIVMEQDYNLKLELLHTEYEQLVPVQSLKVNYDSRLHPHNVPIQQRDLPYSEASSVTNCRYHFEAELKQGLEMQQDELQLERRFVPPAQSLHFQQLAVNTNALHGSDEQKYVQDYFNTHNHHQNQNPSPSTIPSPELAETIITEPKDKVISKTFCNICKLYFRNVHELSVHHKIHTLNYPYICDVCHQRSESFSRLQQHMHSHLIYKPQVCNICKREYTDSPADIHKCSACEFSLPQIDLLQRQSICTHDIPVTNKILIKEIVVSQDSGALFSNQPLNCTTVPIHSKEIVPQIIPKTLEDISPHSFLISQMPPNESKVNLKFECDMCEASFMEQGALQFHKSSQHIEIIIHKCEKCQLTFTTNKEMELHNLSSHSVQKEGGVGGEDETNAMVSCKESNSSAEVLSLHLAVFIRHEEQGPESNSKSKITELVPKLSLHEESGMLYENENKISPSIKNALKKKSKKRKNPYVKKNIPPREKNKIICTLCNKEFATKNNLKNHIRLHTGEKPYNCSQCKKGFACKSNLTNHLPIHMKDRPSFKCDFCTKIFTCNRNLILHLSTHDPSIQIKCKMCTRVFNNTDKLQCHMMIQHSQKKCFNCDACGKMFKYPCHLLRHIHSFGEKTCKARDRPVMISRDNSTPAMIDHLESLAASAELGTQLEHRPSDQCVTRQHSIPMQDQRGSSHQQHTDMTPQVEEWLISGSGARGGGSKRSSSRSPALDPTPKGVEPLRSNKKLKNVSAGGEPGVLRQQCSTAAWRATSDLPPQQSQFST